MVSQARVVITTDTALYHLIVCEAVGKKTKTNTSVHDRKLQVSKGNVKGGGGQQNDVLDVPE